MKRGRSLLWLVLLAVGAFAVTAQSAAAVTVTTTADGNDHECAVDCTLREAIEVATGGETVTVPAAASPYQVTDALGDLLINKSIVVAGAGARTTEVTAPGTNVSSSVRNFTVVSTGLVAPTVTIQDLSITGGNGRGAVPNGVGGGVLAYRPGMTVGGPTLTLVRVRVAGNIVSLNGSFQTVGGGVTSYGNGTSVEIRDSLIANNQAIGTGGAQATGGGASAFALGKLALSDTTVTGNKALSDSTSFQSAVGGGVSAPTSGSLVNVTLAANSATRTAPGAIAGTGGNLSISSSTTVKNTIITGGVADAPGTGDCIPAVTSQGGNVLPLPCGPGPADRTSDNPLLGPLADNGGQTDTMGLLTGSPAIDAGTGCPPPAADQRGIIRPQGTACDAGAFELEQTPPPPGPPRCEGRVATIVGTGAANTLKGTPKKDVIAALGGADRISALGGNDFVCAGPGGDKVAGGKGKDLINGDRGNDRVAGGPGKDRLRGNKGRDVLIGGPGVDALAGGPGKDKVRQ
jgi:CSLREA domain-containing protein